MVSRITNLGAFTLIEMAIVLTIIGLLTGGVLVGRDVIHAGQVASITEEYQVYTDAVLSFRDQYHALPGDFKRAEQVWGSDACGALYTGTVASGKTCKGNGDGVISQNAVTNASAERYQFWNQLALAKLISGSYTGYAGTSGVPIPGVDVPRSKLSGTAWNVGNLGTRPASGALNGFVEEGIWFDAVYNNLLFFGKLSGGCEGWDVVCGALTPAEASNIDIKIDDGMPANGKVLTRNIAGCVDTAPAHTASVKTTAQYMLTNQNVACNLLFINQW